MPTLSVRCRRSDAFTLVELRLQADRPCRVHVEAPPDVTVWPPRCRGEPEPGWHENGYSGVIDRGPTGLGFATPDAIDSSSIDLVESEPVRSATTPEGVDAWFGRIETRLRRAERLQEAESVQEASDAISAIGGLSETRELVDAIDRDRRLLARLDTVPGTLHRRLEAIDIEMEPYEKLS